MKLSTENQELLDALYPDGYKIKKIKANGKVIDEADLYHILFVKIFKTGGRSNKLSPMVQKINVKDFEVMRKQLDKGWKLSAITGYDEMAIIHDPTGVTEAAQAAELEKERAAEAELKAQEDAAAKVESDRVAAEKAEKQSMADEKERLIQEAADLKAEKEEIEKEKKVIAAEKKKLADKPKAKPGPKPKEAESQN